MLRRVRVAVALAGLAGAGLAAQQRPSSSSPSVPAQEPAATFRAEANYVEVDAVVTDSQGRPVTNLRQDEFELREDGVIQNLTAFSHLDIAIQPRDRDAVAGSDTPSRMPLIEPDVRTNEYGEGRIYLIVLDDLNTDFTRVPRAKLALRRFVERQLGANDLAAVVFTGRQAADNQDFTNDRRLLLAAVDKFTGQQLPSEVDERREMSRVLVPTTSVTITAPDNPNAGKTFEVAPFVGDGAPGEVDPYEGERAARARSVAETIRRLAEFMSGVRGRRKSMLLVGEGIDFNLEQVVEQDSMGDFGTRRNARVAASASRVRADIHDAIAAATRSNVSIYALDPRGLPTPGGDNDIGIGANNRAALFSEQEMAAIAQGVAAEAVVANRTKLSIEDEIRRAQNSLRVLAENTGGFAAVNQNDLNRAFDRIISENSSYYMLGYYAANGRRDGVYRKLQVRVKRPGLQVRARDGYYEAKGGAPSRPAFLAAASSAPTMANRALAVVLASPLPVATLPFRVVASPFKGAEAPNAAIALSIEIDAAHVAFKAQDGKVSEPIEVAYVATNAEGKIYEGPSQTSTFRLPADSFAKAQAEGLRLRVLSQVDLPPGRYQLRVAAGTRAGRAGSVLYDLLVPDFHTEGLVMSGVAMASATESRTLQAQDSQDDIPGFLPGPPTASREFGRGDTIALFTEIYAAGANPPWLDLMAELRADGDGGRAVKVVRESHTASTTAGASDAATFSPTFSLAEVPAGSYVIHIEARAPAAVVSRDIPIRVK